MGYQTHLLTSLKRSAVRGDLTARSLDDSSSIHDPACCVETFEPAKSKNNNLALKHENSLPSLFAWAGTKPDPHLEKKSESSRTLKIVLGFVLLSVFSLVLVDSMKYHRIEHHLELFLQWVREKPFRGFFAFVIINSLATVFFFPVPLLTIGGGFTFAHEFGLGVGGSMAILGVFLGASIGSILAFSAGRYLLRQWVVKRAHQYTSFRVMDKVLEGKGFRILALLHLCPVVPFSALNYIAGTTAVPLHEFVLALVAILPGTAVYVFIGASADTLVRGSSVVDETNSTSKRMLTMIAVCAGIVGIVLTSYYAKIEIAKAAELENKQTQRRRSSKTAEKLIV